MKTYDLIELAGRNLRQSVLRNSLTTIGISVGVASLVSMLSLGIGLQQLATKRLEKSGLFGTVIVTPGRPGRGLMLRGRERQKDTTAESRPLDEAARQEIAQLPYVAETFADVRFPMELSYEDVKPRRITAAGVPASAKATEAFEDVKGHFFSSETAAEVILPKGTAGELTGRVTKRRDAAELDPAELARELVGKSITMTYAERAAGGIEVSGYSIVPHAQTLKIVGILDLNPEGMRGPGAARAFLPLKFADALHAFQPSDVRESMHTEGPPTYLSLNVRLKDPSRMQGVEDAIKKMGFSTFSILDATRSIQQVFAVFDVFLGVFGSLALAVASLGIVNTLVMAILERRREIGIMKAIGASDQDVRRIFFAEAGAMGVVGGAVGVTLGWGIGQVINFGTNIYLTRQSLPTAQIWFVPWWLVAGAIGFALVVSLASGWYPAARAARLDPVQALRYE